MSNELSDQIAKAVADAMPSKDEILKAITDGVYKSFGLVWESQILDAITDETNEALAPKKTKRL